MEPGRPRFACPSRQDGRYGQSSACPSCFSSHSPPLGRVLTEFEFERLCVTARPTLEHDHFHPLPTWNSADQWQSMGSAQTTKPLSDNKVRPRCELTGNRSNDQKVRGSNPFGRT